MSKLFTRMQAILKPLDLNPNVIDLKKFLVKYESCLILNRVMNNRLKRTLLIHSLEPKPLQTLILLCCVKISPQFLFKEVLQKLESNYRKITSTSPELNLHINKQWSINSKFCK